MPFVPHIRKQITNALDVHILPALRRDSLLQVIVQEPYQFPQIQTEAIAAPLLDDYGHWHLKPSANWKKERMSSGRSPSLVIILKGTYEHTVGVTQQMVEKAEALGNTLDYGRLKLSLPAPSCLYIPSFIPGQDGTLPFHGNKEPVEILWLNLWNEEILAHVAESSEGGVVCSHSLAFKDASLMQMARLYEEELQLNPDGPNYSAQAQLFVFCSRMRRILQTTAPPLINTSWNEGGVQDPSKMGQLCFMATQYIECHLNEPLNRQILAEKLGVSPSYLNHVFRQVEGISLMRYVTQRRVKAAQNILKNTGESLKDISQLTGFASPASFCAVFKRTTGMSPIAYRRNSRLTE